MPPPAAWGDGSGAACSSPDTWSSDCVDLSARSGWASFMSFCVVVFPAMDVLSAYPLKAITLGNTLFSGLCGDAMVLHTVTSPLPSAREMLGWACRRGRRSIPTASLATPLAPPPSPPASSYGGAPVREERQGLLRTEGAGEAARSPGWRAWVLASNSRVWTLRTACRLVAAAPPVLGAAIESDIGTIIAYTGILGVVIAFIVPAYLQLASIASMSKAAAAALRKDSGDATPAAPSAAGAAAVNSSPAAAAGGGKPHAVPSWRAVWCLQRPLGALPRALTPYTSWAARSGIPQAVIVAAIALMVYIVANLASSS